MQTFKFQRYLTIVDSKQLNKVGPRTSTYRLPLPGCYSAVTTKSFLVAKWYIPTQSNPMSRYRNT